MIQIKSKFDGWREITKEDALEHAKWKFRAIQTFGKEQKKLDYINERLRGIKFNLKDLCQE
jgi:hypothetical protein